MAVTCMIVFTDAHGYSCVDSRTSRIVGSYNPAVLSVSSISYLEIGNGVVVQNEDSFGGVRFGIESHEVGYLAS